MDSYDEIAAKKNPTAYDGTFVENAPKESLDFEDLAQEKHGVLEYPLRKPEEDPPWAVNIIRVWAVIATSLITLICLGLVAGAIFD